MLEKQKNYIKEIGLLFKDAIIYKELFKDSLGEEKEEIWEKVGEIILNHIYGYKLENLNNKYKNIDGIDLGDESKSLGVQVSVTASANKIKDSVKKYKKGEIITEEGVKVKLYDKYNHLKFLFIKESYSPNITIDTEGKFEFDIKNDIFTFNKIICDLGNKDPIELENIYKYLRKNVFSSLVPLLRDLLSDDKFIEKNELLLNSLKETSEEIQSEIDLSYKIKNNIKEEYEIKVLFETFSDTLNYINKHIIRYKNGDLTGKETELFLENVKNSEILSWHFFHNFSGVFNYKEIFDKIISFIIRPGSSINLILKLLLWLEEYGIKDGNHNLTLKILYDISNNYDVEFINRRIAIILNYNGNIVFDDSKLVIALLKNLLDENYFIVVEFVSMFIEKYFSNFSFIEKEKVLNFFYFEGDTKHSNSLIKITKEDNYYDKRLTFAYIKIVISILGNNYEIVFQKLLKLLDVKYGDIRRLGIYDLPAKPNFKVEFDIDIERSLKKSIFLILGKNLLEISNNDRVLFAKISNYIIENICVQFFIELINHVIIQSENNYDDIIEKLTKNIEIRKFISVYYKRWGEKVYKHYLEQNPIYIDTYIEEIKKLKKEKYTYIGFLSVIPKNKQSQDIKNEISEFEKENNFKVNFEDDKDFKVEFNGLSRELKVKINFNNGMSKDDFIKEVSPIANLNSFEIWDYSKIIEEFVKNNIYLVKDSYEDIFNKNQILGSFIIKGFIIYLKDKYSNSSLPFYIELSYLYSIILDEDKQSKLEVGRLIDDNNYLRHEYTGKLKNDSEETYKQILNLILDLSNNKDPEEEGNETSLDTGLTLGLNSVRGLGVICTCIFLYYYPDNETLKSKIIELINDHLEGIQTTVIYYSIYLLDNNYEFVKGYINNYKYCRIDIIDNVIVKNIFGRICNKDIDENRDLFSELMKTGNKEIQNDLGNLLGSIVAHKIKGYDEILDRLLKNEVGSTEMVKGLSFFMENHIPKISISDLENYLDIFTKIINYEENKEEKNEDNSVIYRLSYVFYDKTLPIDFFPIFKRKSIFDSIISKTKNGGVYNNLNKYLFRIIENGDYIDDVLDILILEGEKNKDFFTDPWATRDLGKMLDILYTNYDGRNNIKVNNIFDEGLKYGNKDCYIIYDKYYRE